MIRLKLNFKLIFLLLLYCSTIVYSIDTILYPNSAVINTDIKVYWRTYLPTDSSISLAVECKTTTSFCAMGFSTNNMMLSTSSQGSDAVIATQLSPPSWNVGVYLLTVKSAAPATSSLLTISNTSVEVSGGFTTVYFTRPFSSGKNQISNSTNNWIIASLGKSYTLSAGHNSRGPKQINFSLFPGVPAPQPIIQPSPVPSPTTPQPSGPSPQPSGPSPQPSGPSPQPSGPSPQPSGPSPQSPGQSPQPSGPSPQSPGQTPAPSPVSPSPQPSNSRPSLDGYDYSIVLIGPDVLKLYWKPITSGDKTITMALHCKCTGWLGVGFSTSSSMIEYPKSTDIIAGSAVPGGTKRSPLDTFDVHAYEFVDYVKPDGYSSILDVTETTGYQETDGETTLFFTRLIDAGANPIQNSSTHLIGAYSGENSDVFSYHGSSSQYTSRKSDVEITVNFYLPPPPPPPSPQPSPQTPPPPSSNPSPVPSPPPTNLDGYIFNITLLNSLILYWKPITGSTISLALTCKCTGWLGVGWSSSSAMVESGKPTDVVAGWVSGTPGTATVNAYKFTAKSTPSGFSTDITLTDTSGSQINGETTIFFTRPVNAGSNPISKDSSSHLIGAYSETNSDTFGYHGTTHTSIGATLQANFFTGAIVVTEPTIELRDIHAIILFVAWGLILPFGMIWARYTRHLPNAIWFKVHRVFQYGGFIISLAGILLGYIMVGDPSNQFRLLAHATIGTIILFLSLSQVIAAFFRPHKEPGEAPTKARLLFEIFHHWNGRLLIILAVAQIYLGIYARGFDLTQPWLIPAWSSVVGLAGLIVIILEIMKRIKDNEREDRFEMK